MKRIVSLIGAGAMLLSVAGPAFGAVTINKAKIKNVTIVKAETGENQVGNGVSVEKAHVGGSVGVSGNNDVTTGNASAKNLGVIAANTSVGCCQDPCDPCQDPCDPCRSVTVNKAKVRNTTVVKAETGENQVGNGVSVEKAGVSGSVTASGSNTVDTGDATARNTGIILVNTQVSLGN